MNSYKKGDVLVCIKPFDCRHQFNVGDEVIISSVNRFWIKFDNDIELLQPDGTKNRLIHHFKLKETKQQTMKTTRKILLSLRGQLYCSTIDTIIDTYLKENYLLEDGEEFSLKEEHLKRLKECSEAQLKIFASVGIVCKPKNAWNRNREKLDYYYYLGKEYLNGFKVDQAFGTVLKAATFETVELAEQEAHIHNTMLLMRNWARFHNEIDGFTSDWSNSEHKYGISVESGKFKIDFFSYYNSFIFQIVVKTRERAKEMLAEFKEDLEKCKF